MATTKRDQVRQALEGILGERNTILDLQRRQARVVTEASQIVFHAMGVLARQQADALESMFGELAGVRSGLEAGAEPLSGALHDYCLRVSLHAFVSQMKLALESAAAINATALDLLEHRDVAASAAAARDDPERPR